MNRVNNTTNMRPSIYYCRLDLLGNKNLPETCNHRQRITKKIPSTNIILPNDQADTLKEKKKKKNYHKNNCESWNDLRVQSRPWFPWHASFTIIYCEIRSKRPRLITLNLRRWSLTNVRACEPLFFSASLSFGATVFFSIFFHFEWVKYAQNLAIPPSH